jgi:site-specific DNA-methyltransferase (cytosine-N4-specific)
VKPAYKTQLGCVFNTSIEDFIDSSPYLEYKGKVDLILTSPPYPLVAPKAYGNRVGEDYKNWIVKVVGDLLPLLKEKGSIVIEIGNAWEKGLPTMSTLPIETLIAIKNELGLKVCQQFIWNNSNKLPGPASWVNIKRIRVKDSFTHVWWFSKTEFPQADNSRVLEPYKDGMVKLLKRQSYNTGVRPSGHTIGDGFLKTNKGSIPSSVLTYGNSGENSEYREWCKENGIPQHPARMPEKVAEFFIKFLTVKNAVVFDPFAGSNTTGRAAENLQRRWVSVERDQEYVKGSRGRFLRKKSSK